MTSIDKVPDSKARIMETVRYGTADFGDYRLRSVDCGPIYVVIRYKGMVRTLEAIMSKFGDYVDFNPTRRRCGASNAILFDGYVIAGWPQYKPIETNNIQFLYKKDKTTGSWELASGLVKIQTAIAGVRDGRYRMMTPEESGCGTKPSSVETVGLQKPEKSENKTRLFDLRMQSGMSCRDISSKTGINFNTIVSYDKGNNSLGSASSKNLYMIASVLGCRMEDLLEKPYLEVDDSWLA